MEQQASAPDSTAPAQGAVPPQQGSLPQQSPAVLMPAVDNTKAAAQTKLVTHFTRIPPSRDDMGKQIAAMRTSQSPHPRAVSLDSRCPGHDCKSMVRKSCVDAASDGGKGRVIGTLRARHRGALWSIESRTGQPGRTSPFGICCGSSRDFPNHAGDIRSVPRRSRAC